MNSRKAHARQELAAVMAAGEAMGLITHSRLMSPEEIGVVTRGRPELAQWGLGGWCLCTEVPDAKWQLMFDASSSGEPNRARVVTAPTGRRYLVVALIAERWQHRIFIPLLGESTALWLSALSSTGQMQMSIAKGNSDRAFVTKMRVPGDAIAQASGLDTCIPDDLLDFLEEAYTLLVMSYALDAREAVSEMSSPNEVSLSLVLPAEIQAQLEMQKLMEAEHKPS